MILHYFCNQCNIEVKKLFGNKEQAKKTYLCEICNSTLMRVINPCTVNIVEKIDNGCMEKAVEYDERKVSAIKETNQKFKANRKKD